MFQWHFDPICTIFCSSASEVALTATRWLDPTTDVTHEPEMRRSVSDNGPTGSDGVPSDTTEDDWSRGSAEDPDELPSPSSSPLPSPAEPPEHTGPITELDRKVRWSNRFFVRYKIKCLVWYSSFSFPCFRHFSDRNFCSLNNSEAKPWKVSFRRFNIHIF